MVVSDCVMMSLVLNSGLDSSNKDGMEVVVTSPLDTVLMDWIMELTSMFVSMPNDVLKGMVSERVADVDVVTGCVS